MLVTQLTLRDFRNYERAELELGEGLTVVHGPNGAGKTNLLEALYFGCTGRSCRTSNERETVRSGAPLTRVTVTGESADGPHLLEVGFEPGQPKRLKLDGAPVERFDAARPLVSVFLPDRLALVKGPPSGRRGHLDQLVAALWPARAGTRGAYSRALAQRNALVARVRAGAAAAGLLDPWDAELAQAGVELMAQRSEAIHALRAGFAERAAELGLPAAEIAYRPRSRAGEADGLRAELAAAREADLTRGFTGHGPHRDDVALIQDGRSLRVFGSQGQQRLALLALLFAERDLLTAARGRPPLMLLDDVMSELDGERRARLVELVGGDGQTLVTTTDPDHVPAGSEAPALVAVGEGALPGGARSPIPA